MPPHQLHVLLKPVSNDPDKPHVKRFVDTMACTYMISVVSATIAELFTYPMDLTKTRLQIQGEATSAFSKLKYRGMFRTAVGIVREEGFFKLWQGMSPALYRHVVYSGVRITLYDYLRKQVSKDNPSANVVPVWKSAICGITAGCVAQWLSSPADLVKVQLQMEGKRRLMGEAPRVKSAPDAFMKIVRSGGVTGLWKGSVPNVQRAALVNLGDLTAYDTIKQTLMKKFQMKDNRTTHVLSSFGAGLVAAIMGTPADTVKTRIMNQPTDEKGRGLLYKGPIDCFSQTIKNEGFAALYKGLLPCWMRMAPWSLSFWLTFEQLRKVLGASMY